MIINKHLDKLLINNYNGIIVHTYRTDDSICGDIEINNDSSITMFDSSDLIPVYCVGIVLV